MEGNNGRIQHESSCYTGIFVPLKYESLLNSRRRKREGKRERRQEQKKVASEQDDSENLIKTNLSSQMGLAHAAIESNLIPTLDESDAEIRRDEILCLALLLFHDV